MGLNGAGKTTLVRLICGLLDPDSGHVLLCGTDIREFNRQEYYTIFSSVFQDFSVMDVSIAENVDQRVDHIDLEKVKRCLAQAGWAEKLRELPQGPDTRIGHQVWEDGIKLSGGQVQRLMLARALYRDAPILALDEPTAALDPMAEAEIYARLNQIVDDRTAVYISHRLSSCRFCDEILVFNHGRMIQRGSHEELVRRKDGKYYALWHAQAQYYARDDEVKKHTCQTELATQ